MKVKKKLSKVFSLSMAVILSVGMMCGCSNTSNNTSSNKDTLVISQPEDVGNLNPHTYDSPMYIQDWVYEGLTKWENNKVEPCLAKSWDISKDGKEYTFHLRDDVKFTDGSKFDADVVKKNMDTVLKHQKDHAWLETINEIKSVEVVDKNTVKFKLKNAYYPTLQELSLIRPLRFCSEKSFPDSGDTYTDGIKKPVGTGMWKLKEYKSGQYAIFEVNEDYWGEKPSIKEVKVSVIPDANTAVNSLKSGEVDMIYDIGSQLSADNFKELKDSGFETEKSDAMCTLALAVNSNKNAAKDVKVRQALEYGVDKDSIIKNVYSNLRDKTDTLFDKSLPYCNIDWPTYNYDVDKANKLLDETGWKINGSDKYRKKDNKELTLDYCYISTDTICKNLGEVLQSQYEKLGIKVNLVGEEEQSFYKRQKDGSFDLIVSETWGTQYDPHSMVASYREPSHADFRAQEGLEMKSKIDKTINSLLVDTNEKTRQEKYTYILKTLQEQAVYIPICTTTVLCAHNKDISGITFNTQNYIPLQSVKKAN